MTTLSFDSVFSNLKPERAERSGAPKALTRRWKWMPDVRSLERRMDDLGHAVVCWKVTPKTTEHDSAILDIVRRRTMTYTVLPRVPNPGLFRSLDPRVITDDGSFRTSLRRMHLALSPSAWKLAVEVRYDRDLNDLWVTFANGETVCWDVLKLTKYRWETASVDLDNEPFAIGVEQEERGETVYFPATDVLRATGKLPSKSLIPHELAEADVAARAKAYGDFLRKKVHAAGYTQEKLADAMGVSREQLNRVFNGHHFPRISTVKKMAEVLGVAVKDLLQ
jgi:DNA-binding XRE family transcriptional regulator